MKFLLVHIIDMGGATAGGMYHLKLSRDRHDLDQALIAIDAKSGRPVLDWKL